MSRLVQLWTDFASAVVVNLRVLQTKNNKTKNGLSLGAAKLAVTLILRESGCLHGTNANFHFDLHF